MAKDLSLEEFENLEEINVFLPKTLEQKIFEEAKYRAEKWLRKRKPDADDVTKEEMKNRVASAQFFRLGLDELCSNILGYVGISGGNVIDYMTFAYSLASQFKKLKPPAWKERSQKLIEQWKIRHNVDENILKAIALITAKWVFKYYHE